MGESLFKRKTADTKPQPISPRELIEHEVSHLKKKGTSVRHGDKPRKMSLWLLIAFLCGLAWLYLMDPIEHAWYKGVAIRAYTYLHNFGTGNEAAALAACGILSPDEIHTLNQSQGSFQDYYATPQAAANDARTIMAYLASVKKLHAGRYEELNPIGRLRYTLFIRTGLFLPTSWNFLDPGVG